MRANEFLHEGTLRPLIVVDVQPAYEAWIPKDLAPRLAALINKHRGIVKMYVNADETGMTEDSIEDVQYWWEEQGLELHPNITWVDKGFGFLREWMDYGLSDRIIVQTIREMYRQNAYTTEDLFDADGEKLVAWLVQIDPSIADHARETIVDKALRMHIVPIAIDDLKKYNRCYLAGGARNECLKEVQLIMNAFNIKYTLLQRYIWG